MAASLDPSLYPASYRTPFWKGSVKLLGISVPFAVILVLRIRGASQGGPIWLPVFIALTIVVMLVVLGSFLFARVTLYPDRIVRRSWFGKKTMPRAQVSGLVVRGAFKTPALTSKIAGELPFPLPTDIKSDAAWDAWMSVTRETEVAAPGVL